jgi:large subunit ribosomal protein L28
MAQVCELTGKRPAYGNKVSHSNIKTRIRWMPNLKSKKFLIPELQQTIALLLSSRAIRTIDKLGGITPAIMNAKESGLSDRLKKVRAQIYKARVKRSASGQPKAAKAEQTEAAAPEVKATAKKAAPKAKAKAKSKATGVKKTTKAKKSK